MTRLLILVLVAMGAAADGQRDERSSGGDQAVAVGVRVDSRVETTIQDGDLDVNLEVGEVTNRAAGGSASAVGGATGEISVTQEGAERAHRTQIILSPPSVYAGSVQPTASCYKPKTSGGVSIPFLGGSLNRGEIDPDCVKREYIRLMFAVGMVQHAAHMVCQQPEVFEDFGSIEDCERFQVEATPPGPSPAETEAQEAITTQGAQVEALVATVERQESAIRVLRRKPDTSALLALQQDLAQDYERVTRKHAPK